jgi:hypothetical protein
LGRTAAGRWRARAEETGEEPDSAAAPNPAADKANADSGGSPDSERDATTKTMIATITLMTEPGAMLFSLLIALSLA